MNETVLKPATQDIVVDEELQDVVNVKEEVEHVRQVHPSRLQGTNINADFGRPERDLG